MILREKTMSQEIERKFLVRDDSYRRLSFASSHLVQGYLCADGGRTVRVRLRDGRGYLTIKSPSSDGGLSRGEWEYEIPGSEARELLALCLPGVIDKVRYLVRCGRHVFEVDEFAGANAGLVLAEVELASPDEAYETPSFLGAEVTGDPRYYNSSLRRCPYTGWPSNQ